MSRTVRASTVRFKSIRHPSILIVITHTRATNGAITAAQDLVNDLKATNYNSDNVLILTATHRAVRQLEQAAAIEGVNINSLPSGRPVALLYTRGPGGNMKREILQGANRIKNAFGNLSWRLSNSTPPSQFGTPGSSVATSPVQVPSSRRPSQRGSPSKQSSVPPTVARSPSQAAATPRSTSQSPGSGNGINYANTIVNNSNQEMARALYDVFRKVLNNSTNTTRLVAVTLVENGDHVTSDDFTHHLKEVMKRALGDKMGTFARLPPGGRRVLTPNTANEINRVLAPAYAKALGRAFVVILVYDKAGDPPKGKYSQKKIKRVIVCYTPAALIRHVIQPGVTAALLGQ